jgi:NADPH:quinone reductase-like Zn-dependent oxidoreductase
MKAIVCLHYGSPDELQFCDVPQPSPTDNQVLIKIYKATVTMGDCEIRAFRIPVLFWLPLRIILGFTKPKPGIFGQEFAGVVESIGKNVRGIKVGDSVFGPTTIRLGAYAEYICIPEAYLMTFNPQKMTYTQAATIPTGGLNGLHFVRVANIQRGEKMLINGAGGGIGTYALQFAKALGAHVTCVDRDIKLETLRKLGADVVIDYAQADFTKNGKLYDVIIDVVGKNSFSGCLKSLNPKGRYVLGNPSLSGMIRGLWTSWTSDKKVIFQMADYKKENLLHIKNLIEEGKLAPVIDKCYTLEHVPEAHRYVDAGLKAGNVVITMAGSDE